MDFVIFLTLMCYPALVWGHARLMSPPSRSSMWRLGFPTKKNFNDNALYCGGISIQWQKNGGKCGICGDPYNMPHPRDNEAGGKYGRGIISQRYVSGQVIEATVDVTTNHRGYFEFKLCPNNNPKKEATQECLDKYILKEAYGTGTRYYIGDKGKGDITVRLQLPKGLTCSQCVFQWTYVAGNNWGKCKDGESRLGCGPQETFRGCADIAVDSAFNVKPNENDLENKHNEVNPHKNKVHVHSKGTTTTTTKPLVYTYEITKETRQNGSTTVFDDKGLNNSHRHDHTHTDRRKFHDKNGGFFPPSSVVPGRSNKKRPVLHDRRYHRVINRKKFPRYDSRHFYFHINNMSFPEISFDRGFSVENSNWPFGMGQKMARHFNVGNGHIRKKHNAESLRQRIPQSYSPFKTHNDTASFSRDFNLGGRRYKDFWLL